MKAKTIMKVIVFGLVSMTLTNEINAQAGITNTVTYKNSIGLRTGETSGLTYKHKFESNNALELILGTFPYAFSLSVLYEKYVPTGVNSLQWYFGAGGHFGSQVLDNYGYYRRNEDGRYYYYRSYSYGPVIGADGIIGIEYKIPRAPFAFSFDLKPYFEFVNGGGVYGSLDPGLGIKVTF
jgi:hypothetical protein